MSRLDHLPGAVSALRLPPQDARGRDNNFNFLRLVLASLVIVSHSSELVDGDRHREVLTRLFHQLSFGELAVDGFFLVSGFLIVQSWHRQPRLTDFLKKRVLRIYPGFVVAYLFSGLIVGPLGSNARAYFHDFHVFRFIFAMVCLRIPAVPETFAGLHFPAVNAALWTISHEFRCYLLVPLLGWLGLVKHRFGWLAFSLIVLGCATAGVRLPFPFMKGLLWLNLLAVEPSATFRLLALFCMGGSFYLFRREVTFRARWALVASLVLVPCLFFRWSAELALATVGAYALFWFAFARLRVLRFFQSHSDVSYGVYLYGWPTQTLLIWYFPRASPWALCPAALAVCLGLGLLSWHGVELPFLRLKPRHDPRDVQTAPA